MQGFNQMWQNGIGFTATSIWQIPFDFVAVFLLQQFCDRGALKFFGFCGVILSLKKQTKKWRHCWSWSTNLLGILPGSWACSQRPSVKTCKQTLQIAWCLRKLESLQVSASPLEYKGMRCFLTSFSLCYCLGVPTFVDIQLDKKAAKSTEAWTCSEFNVLFSLVSGFYLFQSFQKVTGSLQVGRLKKHSSHIGKPLVYVSVGLTTPVRATYDHHGY